MEYEIDVIVPVYNVENYLRKCIDSILNQTFRKFQLILVDDGSTDTSGEICDEYEKKDSRVVVLHKKNGGISSARNCGIERSNAPYLTFVDSDDYVAPDLLEHLYNCIKKEKADVSACRLCEIYDRKPEKRIGGKPCRVVSSREAVRLVMEAEIISVHSVGKLYKKELFETVKYPDGRTAEDAFVIVDILKQCKRIVITTAEKYFYIHHENSITTRSFDIRTLDVIRAYEHNYKLIKKQIGRAHV